MAVTAESTKVRREALKLLAQVERQGLDIAEAYQNGSDVSSQYGDFRRFIEKIDHFYVFVDLVEERLPGFEPAKRDALARHLVEIRWRIVIVEVDTTQIFLVRLGESNKPWPLGSRQFLERRLNRLDEIAAYYEEFGATYALTPLGGPMLRAVEGLLKAQIERAPGLEDFALPHLAMPEPADRPARPGRTATRRRKRPDVPAQPPKPKAKLQVRELGGRFYVERDGIVAVTEACRSAQLSMDQLATRLGVSRPTLVLMLNGNDPISRGPLDELRSFLARHGGSD